jgi:hypothetical protein
MIVSRRTLDGCIQGHDKLAPSNFYNVEEPDNSKPVERRGRKAVDLNLAQHTGSSIQ